MDIDLNILHIKLTIEHLSVKYLFSRSILKR